MRNPNKMCWVKFKELRTVMLVITGALLVLSLLVPGTSGQQGKYQCPRSTAYLHPCTCEGSGSEGIFMRCENTNLASIALGLANVRLPIEELLLYRCNVRRLFGDVFNSVQIKVGWSLYLSIFLFRTFNIIPTIEGVKRSYQMP